jgi:hypothetical protein
MLLCCTTPVEHTRGGWLLWVWLLPAAMAIAMHGSVAERLTRLQRSRGWARHGLA